MTDRCVNQLLLSNNELIKIDFGCVSAGKIGSKIFKIVNESCKKQCYKVHRDETTNPLDHVFEMEFYNWILLPGGFIELKIKYHPVIPSRSNVDYFDVITDCDSISYKICVQGNCIGPNVVPSVSRLIMISPKEGREMKKRLLFKNLSDLVDAIFMFDIDEINSPFKLDITKGTITPNNHIYVTITFSPNQSKGIYVYYLPCLIQYQKPLITELIGYKGSSFSKTDEFIPLIFSKPKPLIGDFNGYMSDAVKILKGSYPPISISNYYLDFGYAEFDNDKNIFQSLPKTVTIINHTSIDLNVTWDNDIEGIFKVKPCSTIIRGQRSALFEFYFSPDKKDFLFSRELLARAFWQTEIKYAVPIPLIASVRMIGQSFYPGSAGWIPQYEIPRDVILPPSIPSEPVYTNFLIKLIGHLPITFRFISPVITNFIVKPMIGIIYRDHQVITVQLFPDSKENEFLYNERWTIQFNGNFKYEIPIMFKGYSEYPKINIGDNFTINFAPVHPYCEQVTRVAMRNTTRHCIEYKFSDLPSEIKLANKNGIILANEIITNDWIFFSKQIGDHRYNINCSIRALNDGYRLGNCSNLPIEVNGKVEYGYLVALPDELNFGTVSYGQRKSLSFHMFNFSSVKISYKLIINHRNFPIGNVKRDVDIRTNNDTVPPGSNTKIDVDITPKESGFYQLIVQYLLRSNCLANETITEFEPRDICAINCMCIFPGFEVKDLLYISNRELEMSKASLWNLLDIDKFNDIIDRLLPREKKKLYFRFPPELISNQEPLVLKLLIVNYTTVISKWTLKRVKKCDCKLVTKNRGFTFKYKEYKCDHRSACNIYPKEGTIQPQGRVVLTIEISYVIIGKTNLEWELKLSDDRIVVINADVIALSEIEFRPSLLIDPVLLSFERTYIGFMDAANQMCWMYNSTDHEVNYSLDIRPLEKLNVANLSETFICKNPNGVIPRRSNYPIIFKFQPRRFEYYQVTLPLKFGDDESTNLTIEAESDISFGKKYLTINKAPRIDQFSIPELPVSFSSDHIIVSSMPVHSKVNRMITIFNDSKNEVIGYRWKSYEMPGVIDVEAIPSSGRIQPTQAHTFCITIKSYSQSCKIKNINISCQFLNLSAQRCYEKNIIVYNSLRDELAGQFLITDKGIEKPKPSFKRQEKPKPFYKSLSIHCHVYSLIDTDLNITVFEQFKNFPPPEIKIENNEIYETKKLHPKLIDVAGLILEGMIWDIINSDAFFNILKENIVKLKKVKYAEYKISPTERRRLKNRSYNVASKQILESIFEQMIFGIVHEEFGLSMYHFNGPKDIRQFHYQKRDPQLRQPDDFYNKSNFEEMKRNRIKNEENAGMINLTEFNTESSQVKFNVKNNYSSSSNDSIYD